jgi:hypothetical protein
LAFDEVAFAASVVTFILYTITCCRLGPEFENALIGFIGILFGSICFMRPNRFLGWMRPPRPSANFGGAECPAQNLERGKPFA